MGVEPSELGIGPVFWSIREAVVVVDLSIRQVVLWNPAAEQLFGYTAAEAIGLPIETLVPEERRAGLREELDRADLSRAAVGPRPIEVRARRRDGAELVVELTLTPLGQDPAHQLALVLVRDVTERVQQRTRREALLALARRSAAETSSDRVLRTLLDEAVPLVGGDDGGIARWDEDRGALIQVQSFLPSDTLGVELSLERSASGRAAMQRASVVINDYPRQGDPGSPGGRMGARAGIAVPLMHEGRLLGTLSVNAYRPGHHFSLDDASSLETLAGIAAAALVGLERARLEGALAVRNDVLAEISHDLKSPVTAASAQLELMRREIGREVPRPERLSSGLARLEATTARMAKLIAQIDDVARLEAGRLLDLAHTPVDLIQVVRETVVVHAQIAGGRVLRLDAEGSSLVGEWDPTRLGRVFDNLLGNAIKYSPAGSEVVVRVRPEGDQAVVEVVDRGVGIPEADLPRVFDRFYRGRNVTGRIRGSGIGLAGARLIVEQHGGTIEVESREGEGSTFTVRLPLRPETARPPSE